MQTARSQSDAVQARHHLSGIHWMYTTKGMQLRYPTDCSSHAAVSGQHISSHCLQPLQLMTLENQMHVQDEHAGKQPFQCTWWQSSAESSPVHHAQDLLHALGLPASADTCDQCFTSRHHRVLTVCSSFLHSFHAVVHRAPVLPLYARCAHQHESFDGIK